MKNFSYNSPTKIVFGKDQIQALPNLLKEHSVKKLLFVYGKSSIKKLGIYDEVLKMCKDLTIEVIEEGGVRPNPSLDSVLSGRKKALQHDVDFVLAAGGGSAIDAAKAMAFAVFMEEADVWKAYTREKNPTKALPIGTILTLAATGTETNGNTVVTNDQANKKYGIAHPFLRPVFSIIDPSYTMSVDHHHSIAGSVDIMMHVFEQYFCNTTRTETADHMAVGVLKSVIENVNRLLDGEDDYETRANLSWASTIGWSHLLQQGKVGDWATHRLSYPLTADYGITHGFALSSLHTAWMEVALKYNEATMSSRLKFLADELFGGCDFKEVPERLSDIYKSFDAPTSLKEAGLKLNDKDLEKLAKDTVSLGDVGTVIKIDQQRALEIFKRANR